LKINQSLIHQFINQIGDRHPKGNLNNHKVKAVHKSFIENTGQ